MNFQDVLNIILVTFLYFGDVFNKTITQIAIVGYEKITADSALLVGYLPYLSNILPKLEAVLN